MLNFKKLHIDDYFHQCIGFFSMPLLLVGTLNRKTLATNLDLLTSCFPFYVDDKDYYALMLIADNKTNAVKNLLTDGNATLNFFSDKKKYIKECSKLESNNRDTSDKMKNTFFTFEEGLKKQNNPSENYPKIVTEAFQVFECTWLKDLDNAQDVKVQQVYSPPFKNFNGITSEHMAHMILRIDSILVKEELVKKGWIPKTHFNYGYGQDNRHS